MSDREALLPSYPTPKGNSEGMWTHDLFDGRDKRNAKMNRGVGALAGRLGPGAGGKSGTKLCVGWPHAFLQCKMLCMAGPGVSAVQHATHGWPHAPLQCSMPCMVGHMHLLWVPARCTHPACMICPSPSCMHCHPQSLQWLTQVGEQSRFQGDPARCGGALCECGRRL